MIDGTEEGLIMYVHHIDLIIPHLNRLCTISYYTNTYDVLRMLSR